jgi:hypothetical protein
MAITIGASDGYSGWRGGRRLYMDAYNGDLNTKYSGGSGGGGGYILEGIPCAGDNPILGGDGGSDGSDGLGAYAWSYSYVYGKYDYAIMSYGGKGCGHTTRTFGESDGTLYAGGGGGASQGIMGYSDDELSHMREGYGGDGGGGNGGFGIVTDGSVTVIRNATSGAANTGGGGGGGVYPSYSYSSQIQGAQGGSGICIIRLNPPEEYATYGYFGIDD